MISHRKIGLGVFEVFNITPKGRGQGFQFFPDDVVDFDFFGCCTGML